MVGYDGQVHLRELASHQVVRAQLVYLSDLGQILDVIGGVSKDPIGHPLEKGIDV
jgi:hypothetical protein